LNLPSLTVSQRSIRSSLTIFLLTTSLTHAADIPFTFDKPGNVSAAIYDAKDA
jgi:hypothetical protein